MNKALNFCFIRLYLGFFVIQAICCFKSPYGGRKLFLWKNILLDVAKSSSDTKNLLFTYDPKKIEKYYDSRPLDVWERLVDIGSPILGWWILKQYENITANFRSRFENEELLNIRASDLKNSIVQSKSVTLIKSGQALALRPDIVKSPEYIRELQKLQDEVGTFDDDIAMKIMEEDLGMNPFELFEFDPPYPIASASIGQVYRARLKSNNKLVAIKVTSNKSIRR